MWINCMHLISYLLTISYFEISVSFSLQCALYLHSYKIFFNLTDFNIFEPALMNYMKQWFQRLESLFTGNNLKKIFYTKKM